MMINQRLFMRLFLSHEYSQPKTTSSSTERCGHPVQARLVQQSDGRKLTWIFAGTVRLSTVQKVNVPAYNQRSRPSSSFIKLVMSA